MALGISANAHAQLPASLWPWGGETRDDPWGATVEPGPVLAKAENWVGLGRTGTAWALATGTTWAPFDTLRADGFRVRLTTAAGRYPYDGIGLAGTALVPRRYVVTLAGGQALAGGQIKLGPLTLKAFGGMALAVKRTRPFDPSSPDHGMRAGAAAAIEGWLDLGRVYVQGDGSWQAIDKATAGRMRLGWRLDEAWSVGPEIGASRSLPEKAKAETMYTYGGGFVRWTWESGEVSAAGGVGREPTSGTTAYIGAQVLTKR